MHFADRRRMFVLAPRTRRLASKRSATAWRARNGWRIARRATRWCSARPRGASFRRHAACSPSRTRTPRRRPPQPPVPLPPPRRRAARCVDVRRCRVATVALLAHGMFTANCSCDARLFPPDGQALRVCASIHTRLHSNPCVPSASSLLVHSQAYGSHSGPDADGQQQNPYPNKCARRRRRPPCQCGTPPRGRLDAGAPARRALSAQTLLC